MTRPQCWYERPLGEIMARLAPHEPGLLRRTGEYSPATDAVVGMGAPPVTVYVYGGAVVCPAGASSVLGLRLMEAAEERGWYPKLERTFNAGEWRCEMLDPRAGWIRGCATGPYAILHAVASASLPLHERAQGRTGWAS